MGYANKARGTEAPKAAPKPLTVDMSGTRVWTAEQLPIFDWCRDGKGNLVVVARAGTGKTTTIIQGVTYMPEKSILLAAFNKRIQMELSSRITNNNAEAKTLHAVGYMLIAEYWGRVQTSKGDDRAFDLVRTICGKDIPFTMLKLVAKLHTKGREINPYAKCGEDLIALAEQFECEPEDFWRHQGYDLRYICENAYKCMELAADSNKPKTGIDFADMIYLPLVKNWAMPRYEAGLVDEAQDMTPAQLDLFLKVIKPGGRICVVGDDRQAIYGFRGADSAALGRLQKQLKAKTLNLTTTFRCGKAIVARAQELVPDIQAAPTNGEGTITVLDSDELVNAAQPGDFILSRLNAPLAGYAMQLLRAGKRAQIAGRDIAAGLKAAVRKLSKPGMSVDTFLEAVEEWRAREVKRLTILKFEQRVALVEDQAETLFHLAAGATSLRAVEEVIERLFTDDGDSPDYIYLSSVHKAKGLESRQVFMLSWTFRKGRNQEEDNIYYVAVTRAKDSLVMVEGGGKN